MTTIPSLDSENEIPLRHEFICSGFVERIASWARLLCLSFLFLQLLSMVVNLIYPFAVDPPSFFNQILFFLLSCAAFEIFAIPIEAIKDHCIIDLQKAMVVKVYHRYFYTKVEVIAPFDQIKAIGVSSRPPPIFMGFSQSADRYALLMLTDRKQIFRISDYNLNLKEANQLVKSLHESYLRDANLTTGAENMELFLDPHIDNNLLAKPCHRSSLSLVDAAMLPTFQAGISGALVVFLIAITALVGDFLSDQVFNTNLKIPNQPVFQILVTADKPVEKSPLLTPPEGPPPAAPFSVSELPPTSYQPVFNLPQDPVPATSSSSVLQNPPDTSTLTEPATTTSTATLPSSKPIVTAELPSATSPLLDTLATAPKPADIPTKTAPDPAKLKQDTKIVAVTTKITDEQLPLLENLVKTSTAAKPATTSPLAEPSRKLPDGYSPTPLSQPIRNIVMTPLPSRVPSLDEEKILAGITQNASSLQKPPEELNVELAKVTANEIKSDTRPENEPDKEIPVAKAQKELKATLLRQNQSRESLASYIGLPFTDFMTRLGQPLANLKSEKGSQLIYSGITLLIDNQNQTIEQIIITKSRNEALGDLKTSEGLSIGSTLREARARLGVPLEKAGLSGLHFPHHGISVYPLPGDIEKIGSIKLYTPVIE